MVAGCVENGQVMIGGGANNNTPLEHYFPFRRRCTLRPHSAAVNFLEFSRDGEFLLAASSDKTISLSAPLLGRHIASYGGVYYCHTPESAHQAVVTCVSSGFGNASFLSTAADGRAFLWDVETQTVLRAFPRQKGQLKTCLLLDAGDQPGSATGASGERQYGSSSSSVRFDSRRQQQQQQTRRDRCSDTRLSQVAVVAGEDRAVRFFDIRQRNKHLACLEQLHDAKDSITSLLFTGYSLLASSADGSVYEYDIRKGRLHVDEIGQPVSSISLSGDGTALLLGCADGYIRLQERVSGEVLAALAGHASQLQHYRLDAHFTLLDSRRRIRVRRRIRGRRRKRSHLSYRSHPFQVTSSKASISTKRPCHSQSTFFTATTTTTSASTTTTTTSATTTTTTASPTTTSSNSNVFLNAAPAAGSATGIAAGTVAGGGQSQEEPQLWVGESLSFRSRKHRRRKERMKQAYATEVEAPQQLLQRKPLQQQQAQWQGQQQEQGEEEQEAEEEEQVQEHSQERVHPSMQQQRQEERQQRQLHKETVRKAFPSSACGDEGNEEYGDDDDDDVDGDDDDDGARVSYPPSSPRKRYARLKHRKADKAWAEEEEEEEHEEGYSYQEKKPPAEEASSRWHKEEKSSSSLSDEEENISDDYFTSSDDKEEGPPVYRLCVVSGSEDGALVGWDLQTAAAPEPEQRPGCMVIRRRIHAHSKRLSSPSSATPAGSLSSSHSRIITDTTHTSHMFIAMTDINTASATSGPVETCDEAARSFTTTASRPLPRHQREPVALLSLKIEETRGLMVTGASDGIIKVWKKR